jgi:hypothetical protein
MGQTEIAVLECWLFHVADSFSCPEMASVLARSAQVQFNSRFVAAALAGKQLGQRYAESAGDGPQVQNRQVALAAFDRAYEGAVQLAAFSQLRLPCTGAKMLKRHGVPQMFQRIAKKSSLLPP